MQREILYHKVLETGCARGKCVVPALQQGERVFADAFETWFL